MNLIEPKFTNKGNNVMFMQKREIGTCRTENKKAKTSRQTTKEELKNLLPKKEDDLFKKGINFVCKKGKISLATMEHLHHCKSMQIKFDTATLTCLFVIPA